MQVDPALPWDSSVEGGVIQLRVPLALQQLLDGALDVVLKDGHGELVEGAFRIYPSDNKLYLGGNSLDYLVTNVDTSSSSTQYSELILEKTLGADETLHNVDFAGVYGSPAFPWSESVQSAVINVAEPIAWEDIPSKLFFKLTIGLPRIQIAENTIDIYSQSSFDLIYQIPKYNGDSGQISINKVGNANSFIEKVYPMNKGIISVPQLPLQGEFTANWQISKEIENADLVNNSKLPFVVFNDSQYKYYNHSNTSSGNLIYSVSSNAALIIDAFSGAVENLTIRGNAGFDSEGFILIGSALLK